MLSQHSLSSSSYLPFSYKKKSTLSSFDSSSCDNNGDANTDSYVLFTLHITLTGHGLLYILTQPPNTTTFPPSCSVFPLELHHLTSNRSKYTSNMLTCISGILLLSIERNLRINGTTLLAVAGQLRKRTAVREYVSPLLTLGNY